MDTTISWSDLAIIFATLMGPVLAVQAQTFVDAQRERHQRRVVIFRSLMATRSANLAPTHVEALNAIPIEFYGKKRSHKDVVDHWRLYLDHLNRVGVADKAWADKRQELFVELLWKLGVALNYSFTKVELKNEVYSPVGHAELEQQNETVRRGLTALFKGETSLPLEIKAMPVTPEAAQAQLELAAALKKWLETPQVQIVQPKDGNVFN